MASATAFAPPDPADPRRRRARRPPRGLGDPAGRGGRAMDGYRLYEHLHGRPGAPRLRRHAAVPPTLTRPTSTPRRTRFLAVVRRPDRPARRRHGAWDPARLEHRFAVARPGAARRRREACSPPRSTPAAAWTGTRSRSTRGRRRGRRRRPPARATRDPHGAPAPGRASTACPTPAGGRSRTGGPTSATSAPTPPTWRSCCSSSSRSCSATTGSSCPCDAAGGHGRARAGARRHQRLRRAAVDRAGRGGRRRRLAALDDVHPRRRRRGRPSPPTRACCLLAGGARRRAKGRRSRRSRSSATRWRTWCGASSAPSRWRPATGRRGAEAARRVAGLASSPARRRQTAPPCRPCAPVRYRVMNTVPEHWIPFVPVHVAGYNREIQLQRAAHAAHPRGRPQPAA